MARARTSSTQETQPKTRSDAYVGLLVISLLAQIIGAVFFFLDWQQYPTNKPPAPPAASSAAPAVVPGGAGGGAQGAGAQGVPVQPPVGGGVNK